jgi:hypothetical protein
MKRTSIVLAFLGIFFVTGCACLYQREIAFHCGTKIYKGQSADSVERALGSPDVVSSGDYLCKNSRNLPFLVSPNSIEWVYFCPDYSTIIYLDHGMVSYVHQIPTSKVRIKYVD